MRPNDYNLSILRSIKLEKFRLSTHRFFKRAYKFWWDVDKTQSAGTSTEFDYTNDVGGKIDWTVSELIDHGGRVYVESFGNALLNQFFVEYHTVDHDGGIATTRKVYTEETPFLGEGGLLFPRPVEDDICVEFTSVQPKVGIPALEESEDPKEEYPGVFLHKGQQVLIQTSLEGFHCAVFDKGPVYENDEGVSSLEKAYGVGNVEFKVEVSGGGASNVNFWKWIARDEVEESDIQDIFDIKADGPGENDNWELLLGQSDLIANSIAYTMGKYGNDMKDYSGLWYCLEATDVSQQQHDVIVKATAMITVEGTTYSFEDIVNVSVGYVDLDIDSDNDDGKGYPEEDDDEDSGEVDYTINPGTVDEQTIIVPGKIILVNDDDDDGDGVEDRWDGYNLNQEASCPEDDENASEDDLYPIVVKLYGVTAKTKVLFTYDCAAPEVESNRDIMEYQTDGDLRLWYNNGKARKPDPIWTDGDWSSGDFIPPTWYWADEIDLDDGYQVFYIEGVDAGVSTIKVEVDYQGDDEWESLDEVKVTVMEAKFIDSIPDYSLATNTDSDNYFLRQDDDHEDIDIYHYCPVNFC